jgi:uncharacterized protein
MKTVMFYEMASDGLSKATAHVDGYRARLKFFTKGAICSWLNPFVNPVEGAVGIFTGKEAAEEFTHGGPFVVKGAVGKWRLVEWNEILAQKSAMEGVI